MSVKSIVQKEVDLNTSRCKQIRDLIKNIAANPHIHAQRIPGTQLKIIFCVADNRVTDLGQFSYQAVINDRFKTLRKEFRASYYEIWDRVTGSKDTFELNRIYFHLYKLHQHEDKEYILLHTDPKDPDVNHGNYKRSPHLHIKQPSDDIIPHAHFALNITDYDAALSSLKEINKCFKDHIEMLGHQILKLR